MRIKEVRLLCMLLAVVMTLSLGAYASAEPGMGEAIIFENDGMTLSVPAAYADLLTIDTPENDLEGTLFTVSEKASLDAAGGEEGAGHLFSIVRISAIQLQELLGYDLSGTEIFARDGAGDYYLYQHPTDVRFFRESYDNIDEDMQQWTELNEWAWGTVRDSFVAENEGLIADTAGTGEEEEAASEEDAGPDGLHASIQRAIDSPAWVTELPQAQDENVTQLFVMAGMGMDLTTATISMHERDENGDWKQILSTPGFVGKNGLCLDEDHVEGCGQTPIGIFSFNKAFGIAGDPGCEIPYIQVTDDTYWSGDEREGMHYNEMVDIRDYPDLDLSNSEHITDYEYEYQYCLNISFNEDGTPGRGSAIFLHCFGPLKPYTGGCVAIPENIMKLVMQRVTPECVVVIDTFENLNGSF